MAPISYTCHYCKRPNVTQSIQGLRSHISQSLECWTRRDEEHTLVNRNRSTQDGLLNARQQPTEHCGQQEDFEANMSHSNDGSNDHRSKRAWVDDDDDDENFQPMDTNFIIDYPAEAHAGAILEDSWNGLETRFEKIQHAQCGAGEPAWAPFNSLADWELSRWLVQSGVSQCEIDKFLKLELVRTCVCVDFMMLNLYQDSIWCPPIYPEQTRIL